MSQLRILFDVTCLAEARLSQQPVTGIGIVAYNLLKQFLRRDDVLLSFYCSSDARDGIKNLIDVLKVAQPKTIECRDRGCLVRFINRIIALISACYQYIHESCVSRLFSFLAYPVVYILFLAKSGLCKSIACLDLTENRSKFNSFDVFFSPMYAPPRCIRSVIQLKKFLLIYDFIPLHIDDYRYDAYLWLRDVIACFRTKITLFSISETTKKDYLSMFKKAERNLPEMIVTPIAVDDRFTPDDIRPEKAMQLCQKYGIPLNKKLYFHISTLDARKNIRKTLAAYARFTRTNTIDDCVFVLGGGSSTNFIKRNRRFIESLNLSQDALVATGRIDSSDLPHLYNMAFAFVFLSTYEGFGLPVLEAMKCGCPVIASNIPPLAEITKGAAQLVDPLDIGQISAAMGSLYYDGATRNNLKAKALERSKYFTWENTANAIISEMKSQSCGNGRLDGCSC